MPVVLTGGSNESRSENGTVARTHAREFIGTRVRLQRYRDARTLHGWFVSLTSGDLSIRVDDPRPFAPGDTFLVEGYGRTGQLSCQAVIPNDSVEFLQPAELAVRQVGNTLQLATTGSVVGLQIVSPIRYSNRTERVRIRVEDLMACLGDPALNLWREVIDVSPGGIAVRSPQVLEPMARLPFLVPTVIGDVTGQAIVRYCRQAGNSAGMARVGLEFMEMGRIEQGRWQKAVSELF